MRVSEISSKLNKLYNFVIETKDLRATWEMDIDENKCPEFLKSVFPKKNEIRRILILKDKMLKITRFESSIRVGIDDEFFTVEQAMKRTLLDTLGGKQ